MPPKHPPKPLNELQEEHPSKPLHPPHELPPHERRKKFLGKRVLGAVLAGLIITFVVSLALYFFNIPITTILPVAAPVWAGTTTLAYTALAEKHS